MLHISKRYFNAKSVKMNDRISGRKDAALIHMKYIFRMKFLNKIRRQIY